MNSVTDPELCHATRKAYSCEVACYLTMNSVTDPELCHATRKAYCPISMMFAGCDMQRACTSIIPRAKTVASIRRTTTTYHRVIICLYQVFEIPKVSDCVFVRFGEFLRQGVVGVLELGQ
jgi:hypothetical protein